MKNLKQNLKKVMGLILLMLVLIGCKTLPEKDKKETPKILIAGIDTVYFPSFPDPQGVNIISLDADGNIVTTDEEHIANVLVPYWYWNLIIDYVEDTENAVTALTAIKKQ